MSASLPIMPGDRRRLTWGERLRLICEILLTYGTVRWSLRRHDLPTVVAALRRGARAGAASESGLEEASMTGIRLGYIVGSTLGRLPADSRCLVRSLVLTRLLARRGLPCSLVIGVNSTPKFGAHAWVELGGRPLLPTYGPAFSRLVEI